MLNDPLKRELADQNKLVEAANISTGMLQKFKISMQQKKVSTPFWCENDARNRLPQEVHFQVN